MHWSVGKPLRSIDRWRLQHADFASMHSVGAAIAPAETIELDLVTVACNNSMVISEQIRLIRAYLQDAFAHTVIDNSSDRSRQREIQSICAREDVPYIRLPRTRSSAYDPSSSHARALNWAWANYLLPRSARRFGFLDHDVFPVAPTSLVRHLRSQPVWGPLQTRGRRWYLWPGLCLFDAEWLGGRRLNFMPGPGFDVGGRLYDLVGSSFSQQDLEWPSLDHERLRDGGDILQENQYQRIDDWIHTVNASGWMPVVDKDQAVSLLLSQF